MAKFDASNIKEKTNYLVAYDLMKRSEEMKTIKLKHFTYVFIAVLVLVGGTFTVDAMTDNSISNAVKDVFKIRVNDKDYNAKCDKTIEGNMKCRVDSEITGDADVSFEINKDYLDKIDVTADKNNIEFNINAKTE